MRRCVIVASVLTTVVTLSTYSSQNGNFPVDDHEERGDLEKRVTIIKEGEGRMTAVSKNETCDMRIKQVTHHVVTQDLYVLGILRIQNVNKNIKRKKNPVLLFHGIFQSSDRFVRHGRNLSLAYSLADKGFDVWLGNNRGNAYSRKHVVLNPDSDKDKYIFFNYTYEEIGVYDVAAIVDYITDITNTDKVHYIGHSQGGAVFLALNSLKPEYNDKFLTANLLSGAGYQKYFPNHEIRILSELSDLIYQMLILLGIVEVFPKIARDQSAVDSCFGGNNFTQLGHMLAAAEILTENVPNRGAIKQLAHFGQNINSSLFRRWNYGQEKNMEVYGTKEPPLYNLGLITVPSTLHYSIGDKVVDGMDVLDMANDMANARARKVGRDDFGHSDYVDAPDAKELVYEYIIDSLLNYEEDPNPSRRAICNSMKDETDAASRNTNTSVLFFIIITLLIQ